MDIEKQYMKEKKLTMGCLPEMIQKIEEHQLECVVSSCSSSEDTVVESAVMGTRGGLRLSLGLEGTAELFDNSRILFFKKRGNTRDSCRLNFAGTWSGDSCGVCWRSISACERRDLLVCRLL